MTVIVEMVINGCEGGRLLMRQQGHFLLVPCSKRDRYCWALTRQFS